MWKKRWKQLFRATDFQSLMYPCFTFSRILGIFPYKINASIFEASRSRYILLTIITCIICIYQFTRIYGIYYETNFRTRVPEKIQDICYFILENFIVFALFILSGPRMRLLQTISEVSSKLPPKSYEKLSKFIHIKDIFGFSFLMSKMLLESINFVKTIIVDNYTSFYIYSIIEYYTIFQIFQMNMLYVNCVYIFKACFERIDDNLTNLRELMINDKSHVPKLIYYQQRNLLLLEHLKILKKQYLTVNNTVQTLNIIFSPHLLTSVAIAFIEITFELYLNIVQWDNGLYINLVSKREMHNTFVIYYILYHATNITLIVWACESAKNQATKINTTVHEVLNSSSNEQLRNELYLFSLQILHRDNTFSVKGLTVDATLLTAMVGTITTYLLILIQFLITWHSCDEKTAIEVMQSN